MEEASVLRMVAGGTKEEVLAGMLLLLHLLKTIKTTGASELARKAFANLDPRFLESLAGDSHKGMDLVTAVCSTLGGLSEEVMSDGKVWGIASSCLRSCAASLCPMTTLEAVLDLCTKALESLKVVEDERPECPMHLRDACRIVLALRGKGEEGELARQRAVRLLWVALSRMSSQRRVLAVLNLEELDAAEGGRDRSSSSSSSSSSSHFERVATALVSAMNTSSPSSLDRRKGSNGESSSSSSSLTPLEAVRALGFWLEPECVLAHTRGGGSKKDWLVGLRASVASLLVTSGTRCQRDCIRVAANLARSLGHKWILSPALLNSSSGSFSPLRKGGFAHLVLLTAKTEISLLLSDALQPEQRVLAAEHSLAQRSHDAEHSLTAGERAAAHLGTCFVVVDQAIECVATLAAQQQGDGEQEEQQQAVQDYFMLLNDVAGIVIDYFLEVAKEKTVNDEKTVNLAATAVLGRYLMEVPEILLNDERVPKILDAVAGISPPSSPSAQAAADDDGLAEASRSFGWSYLAPSVAQVCEECGYTAMVEISGGSLHQLLRLITAIMDELSPGAPDGRREGREGKFGLLSNCLVILDHVLASKAKCGDSDYLESEACGEGLTKALGWSVEALGSLAPSPSSGDGGANGGWDHEDLACLGVLIDTCDLSVLLLENRRIFGGLLGEYATSHLVQMVKPLCDILRRRGGQFAAAPGSSFDVLGNSLNESATVQEWSQMVDFLSHLRRELVVSL
ncbi:hypothetical protein A3770_16p76230 [Chloropicon primus]|uniref:Uncharacterized protein n=3 Tax=Chloropicon primus TaxID=1764295 RepID=A0A5B8MZH8_9CHLO|nr:hypothetical protein A3770_16p76230 [Chloropicon primus]|eukprot:QDZ25105.1 hypothetical protein A3770_16p76230 [Chloropicon primus]